MEMAIHGCNSAHKTAKLWPSGKEDPGWTCMATVADFESFEVAIRTNMTSI